MACEVGVVKSVLLGFYASLELHVQPVHLKCSRAVELSYDWAELQFDWWIAKERRIVGDTVSRDSALGARSSLMFEEIEVLPCVSNVGSGLTFLWCRLLRVLTAGIVERGFCFEIC